MICALTLSTYSSPISLVCRLMSSSLIIVVGKRTPLPDYMLRRFPPHRRQELQMINSDSESSDSDQPLDIPEKPSVKKKSHTKKKKDFNYWDSGERLGPHILYGHAEWLKLLTLIERLF